jgi:hypothetical protein
MRKKVTNCLSEASFCDRLKQLRKRGKPKAKFSGGLSFASLSLAGKEKKSALLTRQGFSY